MSRDKDLELTKERELELFYAKTSVKKLRLAGLVSGAIMPWIPFVIVIAALFISNLFDFFMYAEFIFAPLDLIKESALLLLGSTLILAAIGSFAATGFSQEPLRVFRSEMRISRPFAFFVVGFFLLITPFGFIVWLTEHRFNLLEIPGMFVLSLVLSLLAFPYWKAIFNKVIYQISDYDAVAQVEKEALEARSKQNVTREEEQETYRRFLEEMRRHK